MSRFFATDNCFGREGYKNLLADAEILARNGAIKVELLVKNVIARAPVDIKSILNSEAKKSKSWFEFKKGAENAAWIAFPEKIVARVEAGREESILRSGKKLQGQIKKQFYCLVHGLRNHCTRQ